MEGTSTGTHDFDDSIRKKLLSENIPLPCKPPSKITVVGAGMVGMACNISILLKVSVVYYIQLQKCLMLNC